MNGNGSSEEDKNEEIYWGPLTMNQLHHSTVKLLVLKRIHILLLIFTLENLQDCLKGCLEWPDQMHYRVVVRLSHDIPTIQNSCLFSISITQTSRLLNTFPVAAFAFRIVRILASR